MNFYRIRNTTNGSILAERAVLAADSRTRRTGLLKHDCLPEGEGLIISPCEGIHTFGMKFSIDVLFISKKREVLKTVHSLARRRIALCFLADAVVELPAGILKSTGTEKGDHLQVEALAMQPESPPFANACR